MANTSPALGKSQVSGVVGVSGTVTANLGTIADVATQTTLAQIKAKTDNIDVALSTRTKPADTQNVAGTVTANAGTNLNTSALALESGGNLATIKTNTDKIPTQGQKLEAGSMPVVLPASQITTLTPPAAITGYATSAKQDSQITQITNVSATNVHTGNVELRVFSAGHVCAENSTSTPLGSNATFTGSWQNTLDYTEVIVSVNADKNSATDGLVVQWSALGSNVDETDVFSIYANNGKTFSFPCNRQYVRLVYTNGSVAQGLFNLSTYLKRFASKGSSHRIQDNIVGQDDAILTKSVMTGLDPNGDFVNVTTTNDGHQQMSIEENNAGIATATNQTTGNTLLGGIAGLLPVAYDYISQAQATLTDTWTFKTGGAGGTTVATITITYTDASKAVISTVVKT